MTFHPEAMSTPGDGLTRTWRPQRWLLCGLMVGVAITLPATFFALLSPAGEALHPYLVPSTELLRPLADVAATWPGILNVALAATVNGVIYAIGAVALGTLLSIMRRP